MLDDVQVPAVGLEYRFRSDNRFHLVPSVGFIVTEGAAAYVSGDVRTELWLDDRWVISPKLGYGIFLENEILSLGHDIEFRTGVEIERRLPDGVRIGLGFFHLSNAGISERNPGTEAIVVSISFPIGR